MTKILLIFSSFLPAARALAVDATVPDLTAMPQATGDAGTKLGGWIQGFYQFSLVAGVFLAVGVIVWAGLRYALAAGNPSTQSDARDQILQALLGLILLMGAYLVLTTVNPNLTNLVPPTINRVGELGNAPAAQGLSLPTSTNSRASTTNNPGGDNGSQP